MSRKGQKHLRENCLSGALYLVQKGNGDNARNKKSDYFSGFWKSLRFFIFMAFLNTQTYTKQTFSL